MSFLNPKAVPVSDLLSGFICGVVMVSIWARYRRRTPAFAFWLAAYGLHATSVVLVALRGRIPNLVWALAGVPLFLSSTLLLLLGLEYYVGRKDVSRTLRVNCISLALLVLIHVWFTLGWPSLQVRNLNLMLGLVVFMGQAAWLLLRRVTAEFRPATRLPGLVFAAFVAVGILRAFVEPSGPAGQGFLRSGLFASLVLGTNQMLFVALAFGLLLMANHRVFLWLQQDIAERRRAEEALDESEEKFQYVFDHSPIGKSLTLPSGELRPNLALVKMLGYAPEELQRLKWQDITYAEDVEPTRRAIDSLISGTTDSARLSQRLVRKDGSVIWVDLATSLRRNEDGKPLYLMSSVMDITERKEAEAALLRVGRELELHRDNLQHIVDERTRELEAAQGKLLLQEKLATLGRVAGSVAHELRNPLGTIRNASYFLQQTVADKLEGKPLRHLQTIDESVQRANQAITTILDFTWQQRTQPKLSGLKPILDRALADATVPTSIRVLLEIPSGLPQTEVDERQMTAVFRNLLTNAVHAMPSGGAIRIGAENKDKDIVITVSDTGSGIKAEHLARVFEPLFTTKSIGVGLGLSISKAFVEANKGTIAVASEVGKGTTFTLTLPAVDSGVTL